MTSGFAYAIVLLCVPTLVLAAGVSACLRSHDDAVRALSVPFAYACVVTCGVVAVRAGVRGHALTFATLGPALCVGGYLLLRKGPRGLPLWPLLGAGITLAILAAPYRWLGAGVLGWNVGNDSVVHVTYADALAMPDRAPVAGSSAYGVVQSFANGYPEGSHALLAAVIAFSRDPLTSFNPVLAVMMAFAAFPAYWLIRRQLASAPLAGITAAGAAGGYLQFGYYSQGFMPQLAVTALLFGTLGLGYEALAGASLWVAAMTGVTAAAAVLVYSAAVGVYFAPAAALAVFALVLIPGMPLRTRLLLPAVAAGAALLAIAPDLGRTLTLARTAASAAGNPAAFISARGNLPGPVDPLTVLGAWIGPDYRVPYLYVRPTHVAMVASAALAALAIAVALWRRRYALPAILVVVGAGALYVSSTSGIYYTAKSYQVAAFPIACAVVGGAAALTRSPWRRTALPLALVGALLLGGVAAAVKLGLGQAARAASVTPAEYRQLQALGRETPRQLGLALIRDDWAKALLPDAAVPYDGSFAANVTPGHQVAGFLDVDSISQAALRGVRWIVEPNLGGTSVPPAPFRLARTDAAYRLWLRPPGSTVAARKTFLLEPVNALGGLALAPGHAITAPATGLLIGRALDGALEFPVRWHLGGTAWGPWVDLPDFVVPDPNGGPPAKTPLEVGIGGRYRIALIGQPTPNMRIRIDGVDMPAPDTSAQGIYRYQQIGVVRLAAGMHTLALVAGGQGEIAYMLAISLDHVGHSSPVAICTGGVRRALAPAHPIAVRRGQRISACGTTAALLDRIVSTPPGP